MMFHEYRLLADDSHEISYLIFCRKLGKMSQNLSPAAVMISALRVKGLTYFRPTKLVDRGLLVRESPRRHSFVPLSKTR